MFLSHNRKRCTKVNRTDNETSSKCFIIKIDY